MELTKEQKLYQIIVSEAWSNEDFKSKLLTLPLEAIEELTGKKLNIPKGKTIVVSDQSNESAIYINIPAEPNMDDMELNEEQLEIIAGGGDPTPPVIIDSSVALNGIVPD